MSAYFTVMSKYFYLCLDLPIRGRVCKLLINNGRPRKFYGPDVVIIVCAAVCCAFQKKREKWAERKGERERTPFIVNKAQTVGHTKIILYTHDFCKWLLIKRNNQLIVLFRNHQ